MTPFEKKVWAATYANVFETARSFYADHGKPAQGTSRVHGFSCAEIADVAVEKLREAVHGDDGECLMIDSEDVEKPKSG